MSEMVFCRACGKQIHITAPTCPNCGAPQRPDKGTKNKTAAAVLAIFLGGLGIHRFYLGKWWGVFYLLFCWTGIPAIVALIEGIVFACTNIEKWDAKYNNGASSGDSGAGLVIAIIAGVIGTFMVIGILAAIALPAYQDYLTRAKIAEAVSFINQATPVVGEYVEANHQIPDSLQIAGFTRTLPVSIANVTLNKRTGEILVTLAGSATIVGKSFSMLPTTDSSNHVSWRCFSETLPNKMLPQNCRQ